MADPVKAVITTIEAVAGIDTYLPSGKFYRTRSPATVMPPYAEVEHEASEPLIDTAVFDGGQQEFYTLTVAFWTSSPADTRAWAELVKAAVSDWGSITVGGYATIPGVERGRIEYAEEQPRDKTCGLMNVVRMDLRFAVEYTPALG